MAAGVSQGHASGSHDSVGAMRFLTDEGGRNRVSRIPSGPKTRDCRKPSSVSCVDALDDVAEEEEVDVRIDDPLVGKGDRHFLDRATYRFRRPVKRLFEIEVRPQSGGVRKQLTNRDPVLAIALEARHVIRDAVRQPQAPVLDQQHHRRSGRDDLGQRREVEDGVHRHRLDGRHNRAVAERPFVEDLASPSGQHDGARQLVASDGFGDQRLDQREPRRIETGRAGRPRRSARRLRVRRDGQRRHERAHQRAFVS